MRTTLTLEPDVALALKECVDSTGETMKDVVNRAIREGLRRRPEQEEQVPFVVEPLDIRLRPGIDPTKMNQLADELEAESIVERMRQLESKLW